MILGLTGRAGAGKSTVAEYLNREYGLDVKSFAAPLYASACALLDCTVDELKTWKNDPAFRIELNTVPDLDTTLIHKSMTVRTFLQRYGTEAHRDVFGADFWAERPWRDWHGQVDWVFEDVRFNNEADAIREHGGTIVRIDRPYVGLAGPEALHPSEAGVPADVIFYNNGELVELFEDIRQFLADEYGRS